MPYDRQLVLNVLTGNDHENNTVLNSSYGLQYKRLEYDDPEEMYITGDKPEGDIVKALSELTKNSRLYINGHCDWQHCKLGVLTGMELATILTKSSLTTVGLISVLGCAAARGKATDVKRDKFKLKHSTDSFASQLHQSLGDYGCYTRVVARMYDVFVYGGDENPTIQANWGKKTTAFDDEDKHYSKRKESKVMYYWHDNQQMRKFVDYNRDPKRISIELDGKYYGW